MSDTIEGRKVFFVKPSSVIQKEMVAELIRQEYEVFLVPDTDRAKALFRLFPDCVAFLNIDEGLSEEDWDSFIAEVQDDPALSGVSLGIVTYNRSPELAQKYLMERQLPAGFVRLTLGLAESTQTVLKVLEANEVKGRRKFLRVKCADNTRLNFMTQFGMIDGRVVEISVVGMTCVFNPDKDWKKNSVVDGVQLKLKSSLCLVDGYILGHRMSAENSHERQYVVLFDPKTPPVQKEKIRTYMQWALQVQIEAAGSDAG